MDQRKESAKIADIIMYGEIILLILLLILFYSNNGFGAVYHIIDLLQFLYLIRFVTIRYPIELMMSLKKMDIINNFGIPKAYFFPFSLD